MLLTDWQKSSFQGHAAVFLVVALWSTVYLTNGTKSNFVSSYSTASRIVAGEGATACSCEQRDLAAVHSEIPPFRCDVHTKAKTSLWPSPAVLRSSANALRS